jgi:hypothetical protein
VKTALALVAGCAVAIAVAVVLARTYSWWESALVGVFCGVPVFLLGAVWAGAAHTRRPSAS